jgi:hypothetical protein
VFSRSKVIAVVSLLGVINFFYLLLIEKYNFLVTLFATIGLLLLSLALKVGWLLFVDRVSSSSTTKKPIWLVFIFLILLFLSLLFTYPLLAIASQRLTMDHGEIVSVGFQ